MKRILSVGLLALTMMVGAQAATLSFSQSTTNFNLLGTTGVSTGVVSNLGSGISQFDPSQGTLNSITIQIVSYVAGSASYTNVGAEANTINYGACDVAVGTCNDPFLTVTGGNLPASYLQTTSLFPNYATVLVLGIGGTGGFALTSDTSNNGAGVNPTSSVPYVGAGFLGNIFTITPTFAWRSDGTGDYTSDQRSRYGAQITVTYDYTPRDDGQIPEPSSMALLGFGLAGLGLLGRRMRS
jgi:hypothetical protein